MKKKLNKELVFNKEIKTVLSNNQLLQIIGGNSVHTSSGQPGQSGTILIRG
jgi:hypothetical protein